MALPASDYDTATLTNPDSSLTDFSLIVDLSRMSASWWAAVDTTDGTKGRAAKDSGPTELACDWIDFDSVNETGLLRVKWSGTLASSGTQTLRVYPPMAANASVAAADTYGSDNAYASHWITYLPLQHDGVDRAPIGNTWTNIGTVSFGGVAGKLGNATEFDGSTQALETLSAVVSAEPMTMMCWQNDSTAGDARVAINNTGNPNDGWGLDTVTSGGTKLSASCSDPTPANASAVAASVVPADGTWYHGAAVFHSDTSRFAFMNGVKGSENTVSVAPNPSVDPATAVGRSPRFDGADYAGALQEIQIHNVALADAWIKYEYDQTNDQATFYGTWVYSGAAATTTTTSSGAGTALPAIMHHRRMMGVS